MGDRVLCNLWKKFMEDHNLLNDIKRLKLGEYALKALINKAEEDILPTFFEIEVSGSRSRKCKFCSQMISSANKSTLLAHIFLFKCEKKAQVYIKLSDSAKHQLAGDDTDRMFAYIYTALIQKHGDTTLLSVYGLEKLQENQSDGSDVEMDSHTRIMQRMSDFANERRIRELNSLGIGSTTSFPADISELGLRKYRRHQEQIRVTADDFNERLIRFFASCGIRLNVLKNKYFHEFVKIAGAFGSRAAEVIPNIRTICKEVLPQLVLNSRFSSYNNFRMNNESDPSLGSISIALDTWKIASKSYVQGYVLDLQHDAVVGLDPLEGKEDALTLSNLARERIMEAETETNVKVKSVCTDNAPYCSLMR